MIAGYPATPLADALDLKPGMRVFVADMPDNVRAEIGLDHLGLVLLAAPSTGIDAALVFVTACERLACEVKALRQLITPGGFIWAAWPDQGECDVTDDAVRQAAGPVGLVDVKRLAIGDRWSALKLMIRKELP